MPTKQNKRRSATYWMANDDNQLEVTEWLGAVVHYYLLHRKIPFNRLYVSRLAKLHRQMGYLALLILVMVLISCFLSILTGQGIILF